MSTPLCRCTRIVGAVVLQLSAALALEAEADADAKSKAPATTSRSLPGSTAQRHDTVDNFAAFAQNRPDAYRLTPIIESTGFESADGWIAGAELCGGTANGFCLVDPPYPGTTCQADGTNCCVSNPHPENSWYRSVTDQHCAEPHIETANPFSGLQHVRFQHDPAGGNPPGCIGLTGSNCRQTAITPFQDTNPGTTTIDFDIAGDPLGDSIIGLFCVDLESGGLGPEMLFWADGRIEVADAQMVVYYPWDTTGAYGHARINYDVCGDVLEYWYNGTLILAQPMASSGFSWEVDRCIWQNDNGMGTWDIDNYLVSRTPCQTICGNGILEPTEFCDGGLGSCPPGRCNSTCTDCTRICTMAEPCTLVNGLNGPFLTPCDPTLGCIFTYTADTEAVAINTCGSNFDTHVFWHSATDESDPGNDNDDCCDPADSFCSVFGEGSDPSAPCYNDVFPSQGGSYESCTCHDNPAPGDNGFIAQILPPNGGSIVIEISKTLECNQAWENGACCDTNNRIGGDSAGCVDDVAPADCQGPDKVFTLNKFCSTVACDCIPDCAGRNCGDDGCGGSCGPCNDGLACTDDTCSAGNCSITPNGAPCTGNDLCVGGGNPGLLCSHDLDCPGGLCHVKNRYLSVMPSGLSAPTVIQVTAFSLPGALSHLVGDVWYAGPRSGFSEGPGGGTFKAAPLQCGSAEVRDWSIEGVINLYGAIIVPGGTYEVRHCASIGVACSAPLTVQTAKYGDVVPPLGTAAVPNGQPNFIDIAAVVDKFQADPGSISKTRAQLQPNVLNPANNVNFLDISQVVGAFMGQPYAFPAAPCP